MNKKLLSVFIVSTLVSTANADFVALVDNNPTSYLIGGNEGGGNPLPPVSSCDPALSLSRQDLIDLIALRKTDLSTSMASLKDANVSCVEDFSSLFKEVDTAGFNPDISNWDVSSGKNFASMFWLSRGVSPDLSSWNMSNATNISSMFRSAFGMGSLNVSEWNVSKVTNFSQVFSESVSTSDISKWNVSSGTNFYGMFKDNFNFNGSLNDWNVSNATDFSAMFSGSAKFNQPLDKWDTSNVVTMASMFSSSKAFNQNISGWNVSKVTASTANFRKNSKLTAENSPF